MYENIDLTTLDMNTILSYAKKYLELKDEQNRRQKKYYKSTEKTDIIKRKNRKHYYIKKNIYHPEYNPDGENEGRKYKKPIDNNNQ